MGERPQNREGGCSGEGLWGALCRSGDTLAWRWGWRAWGEIQVRGPHARQELCTQWGLWAEARLGKAPLEVCKPVSHGSVEAQERTPCPI